MFQLNAEEFADLKSQIVTPVWVVSGVPAHAFVFQAFSAPDLGFAGGSHRY